MDENKSDYPQMELFFQKFVTESKAEWFNSPEELKAFYSNHNHWDELLKKGFAKMNFPYIAELILCYDLRDEFYDFLESIIQSNDTLREILLILRENHISPQEIFSNGNIPEKEFDVSQKTASYFSSSLTTKLDRINSPCRVILRSNEITISMILGYLTKCGFAADQKHAVQKTLEPFMRAFRYEIIENFD